MFIPTLSMVGPPAGSAIAAGIGGSPPAPPPVLAGAAGAPLPPGAAATGAPPLPAGAAACGAPGALRGASRGAAHAPSISRPSPTTHAARMAELLLAAPYLSSRRQIARRLPRPPSLTLTVSTRHIPSTDAS